MGSSVEWIRNEASDRLGIERQVNGIFRLPQRINFE